MVSTVIMGVNGYTLFMCERKQIQIRKILLDFPPTRVPIAGCEYEVFATRGAQVCVAR